MCPAIHISSRSWLRSSSTREPSDPPLRVFRRFNLRDTRSQDGANRPAFVESVWQRKGKKRTGRQFPPQGRQGAQAPSAERDPLFEPREGRSPELSRYPAQVRSSWTRPQPPSATRAPTWAQRGGRGERPQGPRGPHRTSESVPFVLAVCVSHAEARSTLMILPQVHLRKPCYDFYFL